MLFSPEASALYCVSYSIPGGAPFIKSSLRSTVQGKHRDVFHDHINIH